MLSSASSKAPPSTWVWKSLANNFRLAVSGQAVPTVLSQIWKWEGAIQRPLEPQENKNMGYGKRYQNAVKDIEAEKLYALADAVALAKKAATAKFDETIEMHFRLGIDPRHSDQQVRSTVLLPNGLGKTVRVIVFVDNADDVRKAEAAGADIIGDEATIARIQNEGWLDFDSA